MMIISRTPVRISFFGGGTDYPDFYHCHGGAVLGTTINKYTHISLNTLSDFFDHKIRIGYSKTELVKTVDEIEHPSIRECLKFKQLQGKNLDIHIFSDLPARTGLGSSSSFTVGFLHAIYALCGEEISKQQLAEEACHVEQNLIQELVGSQDQFHAAYGGFNLIEFNSQGIKIRPVPLSDEKIAALEQHLLVFYTGLTRYASELLQEQIDKTRDRSNDPHLKIMLEMVYEAEHLMTTASPREIGKLLHESWQLKRKLSSKISNDLIDQAYAAARSAGAYGGKLCGAGSGGFLALLVPPEAQSAVRGALKGLLEVNFRFEKEGSTIIYRRCHED
jgi:D-glycero-alpha-D-manno-heptose-7-phosphate kinase